MKPPLARRRPADGPRRARKNDARTVRRRRTFAAAGAALALFAAAPRSGGAYGDDVGRFVEVWVRGASPAPDEPPRHERSRRIDLDRAAAARAVERYDAQYDRVARYRGVPLRVLFDGLGDDAALDLAILHFANGMAIPLAFRDRETMLRLEPFIARAYAPEGRSPLAPRFPPIRRDGAVPDPRPTQFAGNKLVVAERWHPEVAPGTAAAFSPWTRADTLVGVELVASTPYYAQFEVAVEPAARRGLALYRGSCQFCHGARHVGASFGWDFVDSPTVYDAQSSAENLYHNIAYRPRNATELGLLMPALGAITEEDASALQRWLQAIATRPMPAYAPPARSERRR
ncbi:MAG TPA: cytochrome c [Polyangia bacterium]|nr:cytochrome c [Polyangia bacterium]